MNKEKNLIELINKKNLDLKEDVWEFEKEVLNNIQENKNSSISELHMHKMLFFLFGYFWKKFEKELFDADFEAWKYGPIEINYRNNERQKFKNLPLNDKELLFLDKAIFDLLKYDVWSLVDESHKTDPWLNNFNPEVAHIKIDKEEIKKYFAK